MEELRALVGSRISSVRNRIGFTQEQLCEYADISQNYLSLLENGKKNCSIDTLCKIAAALHAPPSYFLSSSISEKTCRPGSGDIKLHAIIDRMREAEKKLLLEMLKTYFKYRK